jgi:hypothetical protein
VRIRDGSIGMMMVMHSFLMLACLGGNAAMSVTRASNSMVGRSSTSLLSHRQKADTRVLPPTLPLATKSRSQFLSIVAGTYCLSIPTLGASAFEGGVGGLGKTKPETGVRLFSDLSAPLQNPAGIVSAELNVQNQPVLVTFQTPWPLLPSTAGLEARDLLQPESAFVQVVTEDVPKQMPLTKQSMKKLLMTSVFNAQGKVGGMVSGQPSGKLDL